MSRHKRIDEEPIDMRETSFPRICTLNFNGEGMVKSRKVISEMIFRVNLTEYLHGIVLHVFVPFLAFAVLYAKFTHGISGDRKLFVYFILNARKDRGFDIGILILCIL